MRKFPATWSTAVIIIIVMLSLFTATSYIAVGYEFDNSPTRDPVVSVSISEQNTNLGGSDVDTEKEVSAVVDVGEMKNTEVLIAEDNYGNEVIISNSSVRQTISREAIDTNGDGRADDIPSYKSGDTIQVYATQNGERNLYKKYVIDTGVREIPEPKEPVPDK